MNRIITVLISTFIYCLSYGQAKVVTTGNNVMNASDPSAADIVIGSNAGTRHDGSMMWWSNNSASRISNTNDVFYLSVWSTLTPNIGLSATTGGNSFFQGNLGIGTTTPTATLDVKSQTTFDAGTIVRITNNSGDFGRVNLVLTGRIQTGNDTWNFGTNARNSIVFAENSAPSGANVGAVGDEQFSLQLEGNSSSLGFLSRQNGSNPNMVLTQNGAVGIGTTNPDAGYKLSVNGNIRSKEVKVETGWADYVFKKDYRLPTLKEVESYVRENQHLPEVPSEAEVKKNGINVGETEALLLKKIEELTLYLIEKDKQVKVQAVKNRELEARLMKVEAALTSSITKNLSVK